MNNYRFLTRALVPLGSRSAVILFTCAVLGCSNGAASNDAGSTEALGNLEFSQVEAKAGDGVFEPQHFTPLGERLYFQASTEEGSFSPQQIWILESAEGKARVVTDSDETGSNFQASLTAFGDTLLYNHKRGTGARHRDLWVIADPDESEVYLGGDDYLDPEHLVVLDDQVFFSGSSNEHGRELWATDGTRAGTRLVADINGDSRQGSQTAQLTVAGDWVYFQADDGVHGSTLWRSNGDDTEMVADINPEGDANPGDLAGMIELNGRVIFGANDGKHGHEPWVSDGTEAGTRLLADINDDPGSFGGISFPEGFFRFKDRVYFAARHDGNTANRELWVTDGTPDGTERFKDIVPNRDRDAAEFQGEMYFRANDGEHGRELWKTDGTPEGTRMVANINPEDSSAPEDLTVFAGRLFFTADDGSESGRQLWATDGTESGTQSITPDIADQPDPLGYHGPRTRSLHVFDGALYFPAEYTEAGRKLWRLTVAE